MMQTIYRDNKQNYLYYYDEVEVCASLNQHIIYQPY